MSASDLSDRYPPLRDYAIIGDGRTAALIARAGSIDWSCLPDLDSPSVFGALLDAERGGRFTLGPEDRAEVRRRYVPDTNVLETTFTTATGRVRVTDAMTLPGGRLEPLRELARRVEGLDGHVPMRWRVEPRFGYGLARMRIEPRVPFPVATGAGTALAVCAWDAGHVECDATGMAGRFEARPGTRATLAVSAAYGEPLVFPGRDDVEQRIDATAAFWRSWSTRLRYTGPWREAVVRSALALKLLVFAPSGAIAAAATTSLPEEIGGERNWDYRFSWIRDSSFTLEALLQLGCESEAKAFFWWFMHATALTLPRLHVLYRLDGGTRAPERDAAPRRLPRLAPGSGRQRRGRAGAARHLRRAARDARALRARKGIGSTATPARDSPRSPISCASIWRQPDAGIWEVRGEPRPLHAFEGHVLGGARSRGAAGRARRGARGHVDRWRREAAAIRHFRRRPLLVRAPAELRRLRRQPTTSMRAC